jgi:hypothetical protein
MSAAILSRVQPHPLLSTTFLLSFVAYWFAGNAVFGNPDTAWHIATGDWILAHKTIPALDPWSYTAKLTPWLNTSWLWDVLISAVLSNGGALGLYGFTCAFGALNITVLAASLKASRQVMDVYILLTCLLAWLAQLAVLFPQPQLATYLFAMLAYHLVHSYRRDGHCDKRREILLVLLMILWANTHGGFIAAYTILFAHAAEAYETRNFPWLRSLIRLSLFSLLAVLVNPYHIHIFEAVFGRILSSCIRPYLADWYPFTFGDIALSVPVGFFILTSNVRDKSIGIADKILAFAWLFAGLSAVRNMMLFVLLSAPYMSWCLQEFARAAQGTRFKMGGIFPQDARYCLRTSIFTVIACVFTVTFSLHASLLSPKLLETDPYGTRDAITAIRSTYPNVRFYNDYNIGGALIYHSAGTWPVFADGRAGLSYPEPVLQDALDFNVSDTGAEAVIKKYNIRGLILLKSNPRATYLPSPQSWRKVYTNAHLVAYVRP